MSLCVSSFNLHRHLLKRFLQSGNERLHLERRCEKHRSSLRGSHELEEETHETPKT